MNPMFRLPAPHWLVTVLLLVIVQGLSPATAAADQPSKGTAPASAPPARKEVQIFQLKYARATELARVVKEVFPKQAWAEALSVGVDERTNAVIVAAPADRIAEIEALLNKLDAASKDTDVDVPTRPLMVYQLHGTAPDEALEQALRLIFRNPAAGNFSVDRQRKLVIVTANRPTTDAVEALLQRLEGTAPSPGRDLQVRVVWLVNGPGTDEMPAPPGDLKDVLADLAKVGVDRPRLAGQTLVSVTANRQFQARGVAKLDRECPFSVSGRLMDQPGSPSLEISLRATRHNAGAGTDLCNLQTEISAPVGHRVVLGVTPTGALTSAFVIQVLRPETNRPGPAKR